MLQMCRGALSGCPGSSARIRPGVMAHASSSSFITIDTSEAAEAAEAAAELPEPLTPPARAWDASWIAQLFRGDIVDGMSESRRRGSWLWKEAPDGTFRVDDPDDAAPAPPAEPTPAELSREGLASRLLRCGCVPICDPRAKGTFSV